MEGNSIGHCALQSVELRRDGFDIGCEKKKAIQEQY